MSKFKSFNNSCFLMEFANGYAIQCCLGVPNYYDGENYWIDRNKEINPIQNESEKCNVVIWDSNEKCVTTDILKELDIIIKPEEPYILGWVSSDKVAKIITYIVALEKENKQHE